MAGILLVNRSATERIILADFGVDLLAGEEVTRMDLEFSDVTSNAEVRAFMASNELDTVDVSHWVVG